jgi:hypothetical protein
VPPARPPPSSPASTILGAAGIDQVDLDLGATGIDQGDFDLDTIKVPR